MSKNRHAQVLHRQRIDAGSPGSILRDFETLLEFVGADGVRAAGKYHFLPLERLSELDAKMSNPLRPRLERPQQRSFPLRCRLALRRETGNGGAAESADEKAPVSGIARKAAQGVWRFGGRVKIR